MLHFPREEVGISELSGPLDRLNAILSWRQPLDRYRAPVAIGSVIANLYLATRVQVINRVVLNRLGGSTAR